MGFWPLLALLMAAEPARIDVLFEGNEVLTDEVLLAAVEAPREPASQEAADLYAERVERFLHRAGYTLATVRGALRDGRVVLSVDEGLLEKVVFRGRLTLQMLRLKLALDLPRSVFNQPYLDRQLAALSARLGIEAPQYELVPSAPVAHEGPQLETLGPLGTLKGTALLHPHRQFELHVLFKDAEWPTGFGVDLRMTYLDGLELGANAQGRGLLLADDRYRVAGMAGIGVRQDLASRGFYVFPSRGYAEAQWYTPPTASVRSFLCVRWEGLARQRADLHLENYLTTNTELSANIEGRPLAPLRVFIGFGLQHFYLFGERGEGWGAPPASQAQRRWRGFVQLGLDVVLDAGNGRWDRRHAATLDARLWANLEQLDQLAYGEVRARWQRVFAFGWHDLWLKARGTLLAGDVLYPNEEPLGEHMRGVFGDLFVRTAVSAAAEFRFSLTRELFKVGLFVDAAAFGALDATRRVATPRVGLAAGPTFHVLIEGMFQLDMAVAFGTLSSGRFATGLHASLIKVF